MKNKIFIEFTVPHDKVVTSYLYTFVIYLYHNLQNLGILGIGERRNRAEGQGSGEKGCKKGSRE